ncbi:MAG: penicillin-binding protein activator, partial [Gemmatimonadota bacterium]|nr:penicillin-binding protein activator [Gemmatimonadota bacterium]
AMEGRWARVAALASAAFGWTRPDSAPPDSAAPDSAASDSAALDSVAIDSAAAPVSPARVIGWSSLLVAIGEEPRAARLLLGLPERHVSDEAAGVLRSALPGLSDAELAALAAGDDGPGPTGRAADILRRERDARRSAAATGSDSVTAPVRIGAVLPLTGRFAAVGEDLRDGIRLAVETWNAGEGRPPVELLVRDDSSRMDLDTLLVRELAAAGVAGVVGPIRSDALREAGRARPYGGLALVSPTATETPDSAWNAWTLWERERREAGASRAVAAWLTGELGLRRLAALVPDDPAGRAGLAAFRSVLAEAGAELVAFRAYDPDSTTFAAEISALAEADPEGVLVLAGGPRSVLQVAPQLTYYGLRGRVIAGGPSWADPAVLRRLEPPFADYRLVATPVDRGEPGSAADRFRTLFEARYRREAPEAVFAALGFDAATLLLAALPGDGAPRPGAVARRLRSLRDVEGATGVLSVDSEGRLDRSVRVHMIRDGALVPADSAVVATWAEEMRLLEERLKEIEEEKQKEREAREAERNGGGGPRVAPVRGTAESGVDE